MITFTDPDGTKVNPMFVEVTSISDLMLEVWRDAVYSTIKWKPAPKKKGYFKMPRRFALAFLWWDTLQTQYWERRHESTAYKSSDR